MKVILYGGKYHFSMFHRIKPDQKEIHYKGETYRFMKTISSKPHIAAFGITSINPNAVDENGNFDWIANLLLNDPTWNRGPKKLKNLQSSLFSKPRKFKSKYEK